MKTTKQILTDLIGTGEPRWTISAIARAAGVPFHVTRRFVREPDAGTRQYAAALDRFAAAVRRRK